MIMSPTAGNVRSRYLAFLVGIIDRDRILSIPVSINVGAPGMCCRPTVKSTVKPFNSEKNPRNICEHYII